MKYRKILKKWQKKVKKQQKKIKRYFFWTNIKNGCGQDKMGMNSRC